MFKALPNLKYLTQFQESEVLNNNFQDSRSRSILTGKKVFMKLGIQYTNAYIWNLERW